MKRNLTLVSAIFSAVVLISSCKKDDDKDAKVLPQISFKTGVGYLSTNDTVGTGDTILTGINAAKSGNDDVLISFAINKKIDSLVEFPVVAQLLSGASANTYSYDYTIVTSSIPGTEVYTYSVTNKDGLTNKVSLTLVVE